MAKHKLGNVAQPKALTLEDHTDSTLATRDISAAWLEEEEVAPLASSPLTGARVFSPAAREVESSRTATPIVESSGFLLGELKLASTTKSSPARG